MPADELRNALTAFMARGLTRLPQQRLWLVSLLAVRGIRRRADAAVAPLLGDLLSAQAALVGEADLPKLLKALDELGYTAEVA